MDTRRYVLYAEDDIDDRELFEEGFRDFPEFHLETFSNGMELLSFLKESPAAEICLILLDINMPVLTGVETLTILKQDKCFREIPVALFSTAGSPTDRKIAESLNTQVVLKPASHGEIKIKIGQLLKHCREATPAA
jgi:CheY-like chemotaxis protein